MVLPIIGLETQKVRFDHVVRNEIRTA